MVDVAEELERDPEVMGKRAMTYAVKEGSELVLMLLS